MSGDMHRVEKLVGDSGHIFWKEHLPEALEEQGAVTSSNRVTMESLLTSLECEEDVRQVAERLLSTGNPAEELRRWQKERLDESN